MVKCLGWGRSRFLASMWKGGGCWALVSGAPAGGRQGQMAPPILSSEAGWGPPPLPSPEMAGPDPKTWVRSGGFEGVCSTAPLEGTVSLGPQGSGLPATTPGSAGDSGIPKLWGTPREWGFIWLVYEVYSRCSLGLQLHHPWGHAIEMFRCPTRFL